MFAYSFYSEKKLPSSLMGKSIFFFALCLIIFCASSTKLLKKHEKKSHSLETTNSFATRSTSTSTCAGSYNYFRNRATGYYLGRKVQAEEEAGYIASLDYCFDHYCIYQNEITSDDGLTLQRTSDNSLVFLSSDSSEENDEWEIKLESTGFWSIRAKINGEISTLALASVDAYDYKPGVTLVEYNTFDVRQQWTIGEDLNAKNSDYRICAINTWKARLTWDTYQDLDTHVMLPNGEHILYYNKVSTDGSVVLDNDDRTGYLPENTVFDLKKGQSGVYSYYVRSYSQLPLDTSKAKVVIYHNEQIVDIIEPPQSSPLEYWKVFTLTKANGQETYSRVDQYTSSLA